MGPHALPLLLGLTASLYVVPSFRHESRQYLTMLSHLRLTHTPRSKHFQNPYSQLKQLRLGSYTLCREMGDNVGI